MTNARPCGICGQTPDSGDRVRALERDAATWERLARHLGEQRTEPDCDCCGGSGTAPDGSTCSCAGWYPRGSRDARRNEAVARRERDAAKQRAEALEAARDELRLTLLAEQGDPAGAPSVLDAPGAQERIRIIAATPMGLAAHTERRAWVASGDGRAVRLVGVTLPEAFAAMATITGLPEDAIGVAPASDEAAAKGEER